MEFQDWLMKEKGYSIEASKDVISRLKRTQKLINSDEIQEASLDKLNKAPSFAELSISVKSQLRRAIKLYTEYHNK